MSHRSEGRRPPKFAVFQPPNVWSAATFITLVTFLGIGTGGVFAWVARRAPVSVRSVTGIVAAAGGLGGYFPPLIALMYTATRLHVHGRDSIGEPGR